MFIKFCLSMLLAIVFMVLISFTAVGFGLAIACKMEDVQGFQLIMNLVIQPLFFLSSAFFPIATNPEIPDIIAKISYANPLFYMVDGMRGALTGKNNALHPLVDLAIVLAFCLFMLWLGSHFFSKSEA